MKCLTEVDGESVMEPPHGKAGRERKRRSMAYGYDVAESGQ